MGYVEYKPHLNLVDYIDAYWLARGNSLKLKIEKILPDGCVDIILNLGDDCEGADGTISMQTEKAYLVGTMTKFREAILKPETKLLGIRFKPSAFSAFYEIGSLHEVTDMVIELEKNLAPDIQKTIQSSIDYLNSFFLNKFSSPKHILFPIIKHIQKENGQITVDSVSQIHCLTMRTLERNFRHYLGISPKEFINLTRFQSAFQQIKIKPHKQSLLDIALTCGYYDHAHLSADIKRYTGLPPSLVVLP